MIAIVDKRGTETSSQKSGDVLVVLPDNAPLGVMERAHAVTWDDPYLESELAALDGPNPKIAYPYAVHEIITTDENGPEVRVMICRSSVGVTIGSLPTSRITAMDQRDSTAVTLAVENYEIETRTVTGTGGTLVKAREYRGDKLGNN